MTSAEIKTARRLRRRRSWRLTLALMVDRIERRLGRSMTDAEIDKLAIGDALELRAIWLRYGGRLEARGGRLELSRMLNPLKNF